MNKEQLIALINENNWAGAVICIKSKDNTIDIVCLGISQLERIGFAELLKTVALRNMSETFGMAGGRPDLN